MPVKRPEFINGEIYHTILRGIAGQKIFLGQDDYLRCIFDLYKFNDIKRIARDYRYQEFAPVAFHDNTPKIQPAELKRGGPRDLLVETLGFCLMPDHIHLLVRQLVDNGVSLFFQKMGGYSMYFNKKHQRFGSLFQRPFKAIQIKTQNQLLIVITYFHLNPISLIEPNWKIKGIFDPEKVIEFLESYPWSSYPHYLGKKDLSWLVDSKFLKNILTSPQDFQNFVNARISHKAGLKSFLRNIRGISLE